MQARFLSLATDAHLPGGGVWRAGGPGAGGRDRADRGHHAGREMLSAWLQVCPYLVDGGGCAGATDREAQVVRPAPKL